MHFSSLRRFILYTFSYCGINKSLLPRAISLSSPLPSAAGNLVIEKPPPPAAQPPNLSVGGGPPISPGQGPSSKHQGQINLAQLRLQHMQQAAYAQQKQHQHQHQQHIQQQMRIASQMSQQHARQGVPGMVQQQVPEVGKPVTLTLACRWCCLFPSYHTEIQRRFPPRRLNLLFRWD